jgi:chemotaxis regulatin CheY-phosphate phosphatase CheZ
MAYETMKLAKERAYNKWELEETEATLWGREESAAVEAVEGVEAVEAVEACASCDPPVEAVDAVEYVEGVEAVPAKSAVEGVEQKIRKTDKALNEAYNAVDAANKEINKNQDPQAVYDLVNNLRDALAVVDEKEMKMERLHEFQHLLYQEFDRFNKKQEEFYAQELEDFLRGE